MPIKCATKTGYQMAQVGDSIDLSYATVNSRRGRVGKEIAHAQLQEIISLWHKIPGEARGSAYVMIKGMLIAAQQLPQK